MDSTQVDQELWSTWLHILNMQNTENMINQIPHIYLMKQDDSDYKKWSIETLSNRITPHIEDLLKEFTKSDLVIRLYSYILPVIWLAMKRHQKQEHIIIGLNGMQGSGKTTLGKILKWVFNKLEIVFDSVSLDDFYLDYETRQDQDPLISKYRGPPGTHSIDLLWEFVSGFKQGVQNLKVPIFDKSLRQGQGDRTGFRSLEQNTKVVLLEGWFYGFRSGNRNVIVEKLTSGELPQPTGLGVFDMESYGTAKFFNEGLKEYHRIWDQHDLFLVLVPTDYSFSVQWRLEAEHNMKKKTGSGMSDEQVLQFVTWYWTTMHPKIYYADIKCDAKLVLNIHRQVVDCQQN